ncbi:MAG: bifunctional metallophosphatase/5'-nucleotidase, partial [Actinomycetes bacterium]
LVAQAGIQGIEFRDEVQTANRAVRALKRRGVETIVVLLHEGGIQSGTFSDCVGISGPVVDIAKNLDAEIDLVVTGHTHQPYVCDIPDPRGRDRKVTSASSFGRVVTETVLPINRRTGDVRRPAVTATNHKVLRTNPDSTQTGILAKWKAEADPIANRVVGSAATDINRAANRDGEGPLANLIADAQLAATSAAANGGAQIAFMNPGGVRADLEAGDITYGEAFTVQPFGNTLVTMDLTGAQIEQLLEQQGRSTSRDSQLIFGVSRGFTYTWRDTAGDHVDPATIRLNGAPLDPAATYRVVTNSFLADGGDSFTVFREGTNRVGGGDDLEALLAYLGANSPVSPPEDRITGV